MAETTPRVVVLARPGKAAENLSEALRQAGAELVAVVDPSGLDGVGLLAHRPQAVLVALEPGIEAAVDALDEVLSSPELTVIFDEADMAAQRAGWDAARWVRHLSAKLHRHSDVLPPGAEPETDMMPTPGQFPSPAAMHAAGLDIAPFTREAAGRAESVPADELRLDRAPEAAPPSSSLALDDDAFFLETLSSGAATPPARDVDPDVGGFGLSLAPLAGDESQDDTPSSNGPPSDGIAFDLDDGSGFAEEIDAGALSEDELRAFEQAMRASAQANPGAGREDEPPAFDPTLLQDLGFDPALLAPIRPDAAQAGSIQPGSLQAGSTARDAFDLPSLVVDDVHTPLDVDAPRADSPMATPGGGLSPRMASPAGLPDFSSLSLADDDAGPPPAAPAAVAAPRHDLSDLEHRISGLSLVDIEPSEDDRDMQSGPATERPPLRAYDDIADPLTATVPATAASEPDPTPAALASAPASPPAVAPVLPPPLPAHAVPSVSTTPALPAQAVAAVVLVEAGLGGPDPVRQLLAGLPAHFRIPVVVRLQLQGGRYDRLVAQMERAAVLPITLASPDQPLLPGRIHFLPEGVGLRRDGAGLRFDIAFAGPDGLYDTLDTLDDGALVFLSGSEPALVDRAASLAAGGALVIAQSPEDCYDGVACAQLRSRGVPVAAASELALRLAQQWPH